MGYKNQFKGCLMNGDKTFAIAPLAISGTNNNDQHVFLIFTKDVAWSFVGTFNQYESELFLAISEKLQATQKGFSPQSILPKAKIIDGLENPFVSDENSYWFNVKLTNRNLEGSVVFKNRDAEEESVKIYFGA